MTPHRSSSLAGLFLAIAACWAATAGAADRAWPPAFQSPSESAGIERRAAEGYRNFEGKAVSGRLGPGYYETGAPGSGRTRGVFVADRFQGAPDPFFGIDASLSWVVSSPQAREHLVGLMRGMGVSMARERLAWSALGAGDASRRWEGNVGYDAVRQLYKRQSLPILEMFDDTPRGMGVSVTAPNFQRLDLKAAGTAWGDVAGRWGAGWGAVEVWNEPDLHKIDAAGYVGLTRAIRASSRGKLPKVPVVGGVLAEYDEAYLARLQAAGLLDSIDVFSFHTYLSPGQTYDLIGRYRAWLDGHGHGGMPLWITEAGMGWPGGARSTIKADIRNAYFVNAKAVIARAMGVQRYFPFILPPFSNKQGHSYGMLDDDLTPNRSFAGYATVISRLSNSRYAGNARLRASGIEFAPAFEANGRTTIAAVCKGAGVTIRMDALPGGLYGSDGRLIPRSPSGTYACTDGLLYIVLSTPEAAGLVVPGPLKRLYSS